MIYITAVRMSLGGSGHEHISDVRWIDPGTRQTGENTRAEMAAWIDNNGDARVQDAHGSVQVRSVHPTGQPAYIRTYADGRPTDNLLHLPRYR